MDHNHMTMDATTMMPMMDHSGMDHSMMDHSGMDHSMMNHSGMDHSMMNHSEMGGMDHSMMNHSEMGGMDHSMMNHSGMGGMSGMDHSMHGMDGMDMHGMKMYFHLGYDDYVLFKECLMDSTGALIGACFIVFFVAILYEGLKFLREHLLQKSLMANGPAQYVESTLPAGSSQEKMVMQMRNQSVSSRMLSCAHFVQTFLHIVQVFISYCLMLVFMTYNVWLCLAVVLGAGVGYFLFGWKRAVVVDSNEHCH